MRPDDETPEPAAWINFNAATGERNVSFICESELASIPLWPRRDPIRVSELSGTEATKVAWKNYGLDLQVNPIDE
jgi:hypothetical protein